MAQCFSPIVSNLDRVSIKNLLNDSSTDTLPDIEVCCDTPGTNESCSKEKRFSRRVWKPEEDELLETLVKKYGAGRWGRLAVFFHERNAGQLRARWAHTLCCKDSKRAFSEDEDVYILFAHQKYGNHWAKIAKGMPGRVDNTVKNRFRALQNRERKMSG
eukprot:CAMPEP_0182443226 /NCGR_PEP_ID=MMETSP1172-20130603/2004_1 /TAXON_ID=708627 /ORGANISM="Timspurckia oligopyrenoides, Strain CCMP3278" /LENGTH=158 /DNA_ID=CAMNT_0024638419 /DNA_START=135 /DNA_END=611 /DNA_ORIENTATION=+